jgi:hypothetical protein
MLLPVCRDRPLLSTPSLIVLALGATSSVLAYRGFRFLFSLLLFELIIGGQV